MTTSRAPPAAAADSAPCGKKGRAKASTSSAMAATRSASSSQCRMRRRRTDWYGMRCRNISDGKLHDALPLALNQVHQYRNGDGAKGGEEQRGEEGHMTLGSRALGCPSLSLA